MSPIPYSAVKWGNVDFAKLDPNREPTPADRLFLVAEYKKTGHIDTCAKRCNLTFEAAWKAIHEEIRHDPSILEAGEAMLSCGMMCREIAMEAAIAARTKLANPRIRASDAMYTHKLAMDRYKSYKGEWRDTEGAAVSTSEDELAAACAEKDKELARLAEIGVTAGDAEAEEPASPDGVPADLDPDTGARS